MAHVRIDGESLKDAIQCNLSRRVEQCLRTMKLNIAKHAEDLKVLASDSCKDYLLPMWITSGQQATQTPAKGSRLLERSKQVP